MSYDHIQLLAYQADWPQKAADEIAHLRAILPAGSVEDIQHVGSTAIPDWLDKIYFRDYLIEHPDIAAEYAELKRKLAKEHKEDREMYTEAKTVFIKKVLKHGGRIVK